MKEEGGSSTQGGEGKAKVRLAAGLETCPVMSRRCRLRVGKTSVILYALGRKISGILLKG